MITNIKSINVFPSRGWCFVHVSNRTELTCCCCFGHYFLHLCSSNALTSHDHSKQEACVVGVGWFSLRLSCETLNSPCQYPTSLSLIKKPSETAIFFCRALFSVLPSPHNADVVFTCRVWGFFRFYTKHMIGSFNFPTWTIGCVSAALVTSLGIFHKYYTPMTPQKTNKKKKPTPNAAILQGV